MQHKVRMYKDENGIIKFSLDPHEDIRRIENLNVMEIALVKNPANQREFIMVKSKKGKLIAKQEGDMTEFTELHTTSDGLVEHWHPVTLNADGNGTAGIPNVGEQHQHEVFNFQVQASWSDEDRHTHMLVMQENTNDETNGEKTKKNVSKDEHETNDTTGATEEETETGGTEDKKPKEDEKEDEKEETENTHEGQDPENLTEPEFRTRIVEDVNTLMTQLQSTTNIPDMQARVEQTIERLQRLLVSEDSDSEGEEERDTEGLTPEEIVMLETVNDFEAGLDLINSQP